MNIQLKKIHKYPNSIIPSCNDSYKILWVMLFIYPLIVIPNNYGYFYLPKFIALTVSASFAFPLLFRDKLKIKLCILIPLVFFLMFSTISSIHAINPETAWLGLFGSKTIHVTEPEVKDLLVKTARFTGLSTYIFCIILFILSYENNESDRLVKWMIICCSLVSIIALLQHFGINFIPHEAIKNNYAPYGTIGNPDFLATYTVFILPAAIFYYLKYEDKLYLLCSGLIYGGLLVSRTRGAWIAFAITVFIYILYIHKKKNLWKKFLIILGVLLLVTCILLPSRGGVLLGRVESIPSNLYSGMQFDENTESGSYTGSGRLFIWGKVIKFLSKYCAFGMGPDNLIYAGITYNNGIVDKAHNIYLEMAVTMGIFTLISYLSFLSYFLRPWKNDTGFMYFIMILTYLIQSFFNIDVIMVIPLFWIVLGFSLGNSTRVAEVNNAA